MNNNKTNERYQRQIILKGFGEEGQQKLLAASVLVIGAGGLGCPALQYLVAAGVGTIGIIDDDVVSVTNLHRQILYSTDKIGLPKALCAAEKLKQLNPDSKIIAYNERLTADNAFSIISLYDIILDGSDNFATRYLVNDACVLLKKTLVYGAVSQYEGQIAVLNSNDVKDSVNYRDIFPQTLSENDSLNCEDVGVLGVLPGIIGTMMAAETIKLITGIGRSLINRLYTFNMLNNQSYECEIVVRKETRQLIPEDENSFRKMDYEKGCSTTAEKFEIDFDSFNELLLSDTADIVDVRERNEIPVIDDFTHFSIPVSELEDSVELFKKNIVVLFCQTGKRSLKAAEQLSAIFADSKKIYSLKGGIGNRMWKMKK